MHTSLLGTDVCVWLALVGIKLFDFISYPLHCVITNFIYWSDLIRKGHFLVPPGKKLGENEKKGFVASISFLVVGRGESRRGRFAICDLNIKLVQLSPPHFPQWTIHEMGGISESNIHNVSNLLILRSLSLSIFFLEYRHLKATCLAL